MRGGERKGEGEGGRGGEKNDSWCLGEIDTPSIVIVPHEQANNEFIIIKCAIVLCYKINL